ncbi:putative inorganic phosphate cotransporter isoform X1 [Nasonia vitripennis]|uniref:Major facilitator superfamily (MFS) profile domain-containing protein n=2 Tax=Nasonia vitripennis TaxID=7425 RepID=A0A7M7LV88_NASVI|nr:putative inorganic phosphate cotransporter isoform X1 [Nasonia vitripennis]
MDYVKRSESIPLLENWTASTELRWARGRRQGACIPQRWVFALMGFLALLNAYAMRVCLSIAITEMTVPLNNSVAGDNICEAEVSSPGAGAGNSSASESITANKYTYEWSEELQGIILSSFYWGYILTHLPGGMLAERFGGKYSLGLGILSTAIFTLLTPVAVKWGDATALIVLRVLMGLGEGTTFPALNAMLAQWTPPEERSKIGSLVFAGAQLGTVFATTLSGFILHHSTMGWPAVFYVFGSVGVLWFIVWVVLCYNNPREHPFISDAEAKYLDERMSANTHQNPPPVPWRHILRSVPLWALIAAQIGHDWGFFTMVTDLPKYMGSVLKFSIKDNGIYSSLPYLCMWFCSLFTSWLADWMITKGIMSTTNVRKLGTTIASVGPGLFIIGASYAGCDKTVVVILFTVGMTLMGTFYPGMKVNALDLSPNYSGTLMAITNGIAALTGIVTPYIVGILTPHQTVQEWRLVFWIVLVVFLVTNLIFVLYASGEPQPWNDPDFLRDEESAQKKSAESTANGRSRSSIYT